ncbi:MAG TPA: hypothetical protein VGR61_03420, partial [Candidatus Dormibacteraeota bacterium]|nr:hypothetical protein [Candidatus Dormibacteraeota bacterium]
EEHPVGPGRAAVPAGRAVHSSPAAPAIAPADAAAPEPMRPSLSATQIREVMNELQAKFPSGTYKTFEPKPLPDDVIPMPEDPDEAAVVPVEEPREIFYILGAVLALVIIAVFVLLALNGPLRYRPPAGGASPSPSVSSAKR